MEGGTKQNEALCISARLGVTVKVQSTVVERGTWMKLASVSSLVQPIVSLRVPKTLCCRSVWLAQCSVRNSQQPSNAVAKVREAT